MSDGAALVLAVVLLVLNAFFVGAEFALISARRTKIEPMAAEGSRTARITLGAMRDISLMMAGAQLGITICSLGLGAVGEPAVAHLIEPGFEALGLPEASVHPVAFAITLTVVVALHVVLGEMVSKNIALAGPERSALLLGPPLVLVVMVLKPVVVTLNAIANGVLHLMKVTPSTPVSPELWASPSARSAPCCCRWTSWPPSSATRPSPTWRRPAAARRSDDAARPRLPHGPDRRRGP